MMSRRQATSLHYDVKQAGSIITNSHHSQWPEDPGQHPRETDFATTPPVLPLPTQHWSQALQQGVSNIEPMVV